MNIVGNIISGQVGRDSAKQLSEKFGKTLQDRQSVAINRADTSITRSKQLELVIPISKRFALPSGEFVGLVADYPEQKIELKTFCAEVVNDHNSLLKEHKAYEEIPSFKSVSQNDVSKAFRSVKKGIEIMVKCEIERMLDTPELTDLLIKRH